MTLNSCNDESENDSFDENVVVHVIPETRNRWNHIENLDSFFTRIYLYHQNHGFTTMVLKESFQLGQFVFVVGFSTFMSHCVYYDILFRDREVPNRNGTKVTLGDVIVPMGECVASFSPMMWACLLVALLFWIFKFLSVIYHITQYWDIRCFFLNALSIGDNDLQNLTWRQVQQKLRQAQSDYQICIHKSDLTELDIYHRILRFQNFMVALINKSVLPLKFNVPLLGEVVFLSQGLKFNIELLLFRGPWAPFENSWHLRDDFKRVNRRREVAQELSRHIKCIGLVNLVLAPLILLWQVLYAFFNYAELIKREPGSLGSRRWSLYGRLYLRHFNELDHELKARLCRAYRPANQYLSGFSSSVLAVVAQNIVFVAGAILAVLILLTVYDEDVITVEHVLTIMTIFGTIIAVCRAFIPDENLVWCPETLLETVVGQVHYFPSEWKGKAHTVHVRAELEKLFQYKAMYLLEELLSPLVTPFILYFALRPKAQEIVDFLRQFTVEVVGVGDVCSFAQLDLNKHGNPQWQMNADKTSDSAPRINVMPSSVSNAKQAENGKTELSLLHFHLANPEWRPPANAEGFISAVMNHVHNEQWFLPNIHNSYGLPGSHFAAQSAIYNPRLTHSRSYSGLGSGVGRQDDRSNSSDERSLFSKSLDRDPNPNAFRERMAMDMALSTLLLHDMWHRRTPVSESRQRPSTLFPTGMPEIQEDDEDIQVSDTAAAALLDRAIRNLSSNRNIDYSNL